MTCPCDCPHLDSLPSVILHQMHTQYLETLSQMFDPDASWNCTLIMSKQMHSASNGCWLSQAEHLEKIPFWRLVSNGLFEELLMVMHVKVLQQMPHQQLLQMSSAAFSDLLFTRDAACRGLQSFRSGSSSTQIMSSRSRSGSTAGTGNDGRTEPSAPPCPLSSGNLGTHMASTGNLGTDMASLTGTMWKGSGPSTRAIACQSSNQQWRGAAQMWTSS